MKGIVIVCHGDLSDGFVSAAEMILGEVDNVSAVSVDVTQEPETIQETIREAIKSVDQDDGVFILTDLFGGTPANVSLSFLEPNRVEIITGINLPLVIKLLKDRDKYPMEELKVKLIQSAVKNILNPSDVLNVGKSE
ncbi:MAG: PTS sugar transporter subunit IIA [Deltaproteobacteria bacterium]|nr:PTS sugar transporter subunit IIA [Deltaproteobacteria bacterium]